MGDDHHPADREAVADSLQRPGSPELGTDPRYNTAIKQRDPEVRKYLMKRFEEIYKTKTADEWCRILTDADIVNDRLAHYKDMETSEQAWPMSISMR